MESFASTVQSQKLRNYKQFSERCRVGCYTTLIAKKKLKMKSGTKNNPSPFRDKTVEIVKRYSKVTLGHNYTKLMERAKQRSNDKTEYPAEKPTGKTPLAGYDNYLLVSDKDNTTFYARIYKTEQTVVTVLHYLIDGVVASKDEIELIKMYECSTPKTTYICPKQVENNIESKNIKRFPFDTFLNNVIEIKQGNKKYMGY